MTLRTKLMPALLTLLLGCGSGPLGSSGAQVSVSIAPLDLPSVTNADWRLTVSNGLGETVWSRTLSADRYGDGAGSLSFVGPCDADPQANQNTVTVELLDLYEGAAGATPVPHATYVNPGPLSQVARCLPDQDVALSFDVTIARDASQGFFDIAVELDNVFCSAKLDCERSPGVPIELLTDATGARRPTVVLGFACTADINANDTRLYFDPIQIDCADNNATVDPSAGPGRLSDGAGIAQNATNPLLFGAAVYRGSEPLGGYGKLYWNIALGLNQGGGASCTLRTHATATEGGFTNSTTPSLTSYPFVSWDVNLTDAASALSCTSHALWDDTGVTIDYTPLGAPHTFAYSYDGPTPTIGTAEDPGASCAAILAANPAATDGSYWIDVAGTPTEVYCDMTTASGGWTRCDTEASGTFGLATWDLPGNTCFGSDPPRGGELLWRGSNDGATYIQAHATDHSTYQNWCASMDSHDTAGITSALGTNTNFWINGHCYLGGNNNSGSNVFYSWNHGCGATNTLSVGLTHGSGCDLEDYSLGDLWVFYR